MEASEILLGYLIDNDDPPPSSSSSNNNLFPSKVGGRPLWLDPLHLPSLSSLQCPKCDEYMTFLLQIYAVNDETDNHNSSAFHRTIFLFVCRECGDQFLCFRCQLPQQNQFYSAEAPTETATSPSSISTSSSFCLRRDQIIESLCCEICGLPCSETAENRNTKLLQKIDVTKAEAEEIEERQEIPNEILSGKSNSKIRHSHCLKFVESEVLRAMTFDERKLEVEEEEFFDEDEIGDFSHENELMRRYEKTATETPDAILDASEVQAFEEIQSEYLRDDDKIFSAFVDRVRRNPTHVIRYALGGKPLWFCREGRLLISDINDEEVTKNEQMEGERGGENVKAKEDKEEKEEKVKKKEKKEKVKEKEENAVIPKCENCGADRIFEFQVQPELIIHLKSEKIEFGILAIYTCSNNCDLSIQINSSHNTFTTMTTTTAASTSATTTTSSSPSSLFSSSYLREFIYVQKEPQTFRRRL